MRDEATILEEMRQKMAEHHEAGDEATVAQVRERTAQIQALRQELSDGITQGAQPCPDCDIPPHGMRKNPQQWEIGCLSCGLRARENSQEACLEAWNALEETPRVRREKREEE